MIYTFRIILDTEEDVFNDIEIEATSSFEDFHKSITTAFGFKGNEMASFYISDDHWIQGEEIMLFNMNEDVENERTMSTTKLNDVISEENDKLIYVYDFLNLWTFYVTLVKRDQKKPKKNYPNLLYSHGKIPETAPEKQFESETPSISDNKNQDMDVQNYDDFDFDEHWN